MRCPACTDAILGKEGNCRRCGGVWLSEELVEERAKRPLEMTGGRYSERRCPACDEKMDEPLLYGVPIDHCAAHGMWFDKAELEDVLRRSAGAEWSAPPTPADSLTMLVKAVRVWRER